MRRFPVRERFPRYHIGESLLPAAWEVLQELGVKERIEAAPFARKCGATIRWGTQEEPWQLFFRDYRSYSFPLALHVERSLFDQILLDFAKEKGVEVRQGVICNTVLEDHNGRVHGVSFTLRDGSNGSAFARYVVDATGQFGLLARKFGLRKYDERFRNVAIWAYFKDGHQVPGDEFGNLTTTVASVDDGWLWHIPLKNPRLQSLCKEEPEYLDSVGFVTSAEQVSANKTDPLNLLMNGVAMSPLVSDLLRSASRLSEIRTIKDYSYKASQLWGPGFVLIGDAAVFVDPLWSTGVTMSLFGAYFASIAIDNAFEDEGQERFFFDWYAMRVLRMYETARAMALHHYEACSDLNTYFWKARKLCFESDDITDREAFNRILSGHFSMIKELNVERDKTFESPDVQRRYDRFRGSLTAHTITLELNRKELILDELPSAGQFSVGARTRWHHSEWSDWPADVFTYQPTSHQNWPPDESLIALDAPYFLSLNQVLSEFFSIKSTGWTNYLQGQIVVTLPDFRARLSSLTIALAHLRANIESLLLKPTDLVAKVYAESQVKRLLQETVKPERPTIEFDLSDKPSFACVGLLCAKTGDVLDERAFREGVSWREPGVTIEEDLPNIEQMLLSGESETVEFREKLDRSRPERLARTAVAFANTRGGTIVFGVDDDHRVVGCSIKGMADDITNILRSHCDPPPATRSSIATHQGKELFLLEVSEAQNSIHVVKEQGVFIRANGTNRAPTSHELGLLVDSRRGSASALPQLLSAQLSRA